MLLCTKQNIIIISESVGFVKCFGEIRQNARKREQKTVIMLKNGKYGGGGVRILRTGSFE